MARLLAGVAVVVLVLGALLFAGAWAIGGEEKVSDNWIGVTVMVALYVGLAGSFAALATAMFALVRDEPWSRLWLALATFPAAVVIVILLEAFVFE